MNDKNEWAKLGLAFAVGVSLSAGYVALGGQQPAGPEVVVVQERCDEPKRQEAGEFEWHPKIEFDPQGELSLAPLPGDEPVPEGVSLWVGLDRLWTNAEVGGQSPQLQLDGGRIGAADLDGHRIRALEGLVTTGPVTAVLWIDQHVPGATLRDLIFTLNRAGFRDYALVVAGADEPRVYRFEPNRYGDAVEDEDGAWTAGLSLRLTPAGTAAWIRPHIDGRPRLGAPEAVPLDIGGEGEPCLLGAPLPPVDRLADLETSLCGEGPLGVEFAFTADRSVGDILALRALDRRAGACEGPSFLAAVEPDTSCAGAREAVDAMQAFTAAERPGAGGVNLGSSVEGALDKELIREVVRAHISEVRLCYNEGLKRHEGLAGRVIVEFVIGEDGEVVRAEHGDDTDLPDGAVSECIARAIGSWRFPAPERGQVQVRYPFVLSPG